MLKLFNNDCIKVMENMPDNSVTCTITDIPYDGVNRKSNGLRNLDKGNADILTFNAERIYRNNYNIILYDSIINLYEFRDGKDEHTIIIPVKKRK